MAVSAPLKAVLPSWWKYAEPQQYTIDVPRGGPIPRRASAPSRLAGEDAAAGGGSGGGACLRVSRRAAPTRFRTTTSSRPPPRPSPAA